MNAVELTCTLIQKPSVTPHDKGCQQLIAELLQQAGFRIHQLDKDGVHNLWATYGSDQPDFILAGHTDVVPVGREDDWTYPPFSATEHEGKIYGRGAADMKSGVAAMVVAAINAVTANPKAVMGILLTSDEEGPAISGTRHVVDWMRHNGIAPRWCLLAEPSTDKNIGDVVRVGRRGSLSAEICIRGKQGHIAYPELAKNPIDLMARVIVAMRQAKWGADYPDFPPTSCQFSNVVSGTGATNVIPGDATLQCNFRFNPASSDASLRVQTEDIIGDICDDYLVEWSLGGEPFYAADNKLFALVGDIIEKRLGYRPAPSTGGGTSDGRFIAQLGTSVIELGVCNATMHQVDECVSIDEINTMESVYFDVLTALAK